MCRCQFLLLHYIVYGVISVIACMQNYSTTMTAENDIADFVGKIIIWQICEFKKLPN